MENILIPTTRDHYDKYRRIRSEWGLSNEQALRVSGLMDAEEVKQYLLRDVNLNNIPMVRFDSANIRRNGYSLSDNTCAYKHVLIYGVVGAKPLFCENWSEKLAQEYKQGFRKLHEVPDHAKKYLNKQA